ncbi:hypothetical protein BH20ACT8_BH20ACT8_16990 [soil metagenome]
MDTANRVLLLVLGLLLVAAAVLGLLVAAGVLAVAEPGELAAAVAESVVADPWVFWPVVIGAGLLLLALGLWLLMGELAPPRQRAARHLTLDRGAHGTTTVGVPGLERAVDADLSRVAGVAGSRTRLTAEGPVPALRIRLDVDPDADLHAVRQAIAPVHARVCRTLGAQQVRTDIRLRPTAELDRVR